MGPGFYTPNETLTRRSSHLFKFEGNKNVNCFAKYIKSKEFVPGVGRYKELDKGLAL